MPVKKEILVLFAMIVIQAVAQESPEGSASDRSDTVTPNKLIDRSSHHHSHVDPTFKGIWKKNIVWKPRWVKTWQEKKVFVAVWKRMWGPAVINEWVPVAKPPPGWVPHAHTHDVHVHHTNPLDVHVHQTNPHDVHVHHSNPHDVHVHHTDPHDVHVHHTNPYDVHVHHSHPHDIHVHDTHTSPVRHTSYGVPIHPWSKTTAS